jgi:hypothetical protein
MTRVPNEMQLQRRAHGTARKRGGNEGQGGNHFVMLQESIKKQREKSRKGNGSCAVLLYSIKTTTVRALRPRSAVCIIGKLCIILAKSRARSAANSDAVLEDSARR